LGYTHYFTQKRSFSGDEWVDVTADIGAILTYVEHSVGIVLGDGEGSPGSHPFFDRGGILYNGIGDNAHETFALKRLKGGFDSCKTNRKPYDLAVTACLCYVASVTGTHRVTSDGQGSDFLAGLAAAREAVPAKANLLDIPMEVMESDLWTGPWINGGTSSGYHVGFCVNGKGYVTHKMTGDVYCFESHEALARYLDASKRATFRQGGRTVFGEYQKDEHDIWNASGSFDKKRHRRIARAQAKVLGRLFPVAADHAEKPPAFVRPGDCLRTEEAGTFSYSLAELMRKVDATAAR